MRRYPIPARDSSDARPNRWLRAYIATRLLANCCCLLHDRWKQDLAEYRSANSTGDTCSEDGFLVYYRYSTEPRLARLRQESLCGLRGFGPKCVDDNDLADSPNEVCWQRVC